MIKVFLGIAALVAIAAGFAWLVDHPGTVTFTFANTEVQTTMVVAAGAVAALMVVLAFIWTVIRTIWRSPQMLAGYFTARKRDKGYKALSDGLIAVGEGDPKRAQKAANEANRLLEDAPLALLLKAQAAQLVGDHEEARKTFHAMVDDPETKLLGLRGLFMEAERTNEPTIALQLALSAMEEAGKHPARPGNESTVAGWAGPAVLRYQSAAEDWDGALRTISANQAAGLIDRKDAKRQRAVVLVAKALQLEDGTPQEAKVAALEAHKLAPDLVPAAIVAGRLLSRLGELRRAVKTLETTWKHTPHPEIADTYAHVRPGDAPRERVKRIKTLIRGAGDDLESAIALARVSVDAQDWDTARKALRPHLNRPTQRACLLMADIEEGEHGDKGRVREWLSKAVHAAPDPVWIADGAISDHWAPISPRTGLLDAYEWRVPQSALSRETVVLSDEDVLLTPLQLEEAKQIETPSEPASATDATLDTPTLPESQTDPAEEEAPKEGAEDPVDSPAKPEPSVTTAKDTAPQGKDPAEDTAAIEEKPLFVSPEALPRAPDDPGPEADIEDDKKFRLF